MYCKLNKFTLSNLPAIHLNKWIWCYVNKTEANLASTNALAARCVRVIHAQCVLQFALLSRTLLRSSSNNEPSDPPYRIIFFVSVYLYIRFIFNDKQQWFVEWKGLQQVITLFRCIWLVIYIMVRHNQHIHTYMRLCEVKSLLMIELNKINQKR